MASAYPTMQRSPARVADDSWRIPDALWDLFTQCGSPALAGVGRGERGTAVLRDEIGKHSMETA